MNFMQTILFAGSLMLIGFNLACIQFYFRWDLGLPVTKKMVAACFLFTYVALSAGYGNPAWWRVVVGIAAMIIDILALYGIVELMKRGDVKQVLKVLQEERKRD